MVQMGRSLGYSKKEAKRAYKRALAAQRAADEAAAAAADQLYKSDGLKIAVGAHPYVMDDDYYGRPVLDYLSEMGVTAIPAYAVDRREARKVTKRLSPTMKWEVSREIAGSLEQVYALFPRLEERRRQIAGTLSGGEALFGDGAVGLARHDGVDAQGVEIGPPQHRVPVVKQRPRQTDGQFRSCFHPFTSSLFLIVFLIVIQIVKLSKKTTDDFITIQA